jgi:GTPase SAR1 family protein
MSTSTPNASGPSSLSPEAMGGKSGPLRIVLFGLPGAGKTALVAALGQVQREFSSVLQGELTDESGGLALQRRLYYDEIPRQNEETRTYPVRFTPHGQRARGVEAVLIDSDGRVAGEMLQTPLPLLDHLPADTLPGAVREADTVLLLIDASKPDEDVDEVFVSFGEFLRRLEQERGGRNDVTDLPVFVVLTRCDLLAHRGDTSFDWMERIEERKRQVADRFQQVLGPESDGRPRAFGRLDVRLWATATRRPPLQGQPARPREPYGVAELFRQALAEAQSYRQRRRQAGRRLAWTFASTSSIAAGLVGLIIALLAGLGQTEVSPLQRRVERYQLREENSIEGRLDDDLFKLKHRRTELQKIRQDLGFDALPEKMQGYVENRLKELEDYIPYLEAVLKVHFPSVAANDRQLQERREQLEKKLPPLRPEWKGTGAARLRQQLLEDFRLLADRVNRAEDWYQRMQREGIRLWALGDYQEGRLIDWGRWQRAVSAYLDRAEDLPPAVEHLPSESLVTPTIILQFDRVQEARRVLQSIIHDLRALRNIAYALGLVSPTQPGPLVIPERFFSPAVARRRYERLLTSPELPPAAVAGMLTLPGLARLSVPVLLSPAHPLHSVSPYANYRETFSLASVPDAARPAVMQAARNNYRNLLTPLREQILTKYRQPGGTGESLQRWRAMAAWLSTNPADVEPYRRLAFVMSRLHRTTAHDPIQALVEFLRREEFPFSLTGATVTIPYDLGVSVPDAARLTFRVGNSTVSFPLKVRGVRRDPQARIWTYPFEGKLQRLTYRPGDPFTVNLPLRNGRMLTWTGSRTATYAFEALSRQPFLHDTNQRAETGEKVDVLLRPDFERGAALPEIPDALPPVDGRRLE